MFLTVDVASGSRTSRYMTTLGQRREIIPDMDDRRDVLLSSLPETAIICICVSNELQQFFRPADMHNSFAKTNDHVDGPAGTSPAGETLLVAVATGESSVIVVGSREPDVIMTVLLISGSGQQVQDQQANNSGQLSVSVHDLMVGQQV